MGDFIKVAETQQFRKGRGRVVVLDGVKIAVFWTGTGWFAMNDTCPHMGASLADGKLRGQMLTCYWHEWEYDTTNGKCKMRPWACVPLYEVKIEGNEVLLRCPDPPEPPWSTVMSVEPMMQSVLS